MGRHWSQEERNYFLNEVLPKSVYCTGDFVEGSGRTFKELAPMMQADLDARKQSRRTYTDQVLFQHYYQKVRQGASTNRSSGAYTPHIPGRVDSTADASNMSTPGGNTVNASNVPGSGRHTANPRPHSFVSHYPAYGGNAAKSRSPSHASPYGPSSAGRHYGYPYALGGIPGPSFYRTSLLAQPTGPIAGGDDKEEGENESSTGDMNRDQSPPMDSPGGVLLNQANETTHSLPAQITDTPLSSSEVPQESNGASHSHTSTAPIASSSTEQLTQITTSTETTTPAAGAPSSRTGSKVDTQTQLNMADNNTTSNTSHHASVNNVTLGETDSNYVVPDQTPFPSGDGNVNTVNNNSAGDSKKRTYIDGSDSDEVSPMNPNAAKRPKASTPFELKLKKAKAPLVGRFSDEPSSPTPPAKKTTKQREQKPATPRMKPFTGAKVPRGEAKASVAKRGGRGSAIPRGGRQELGARDDGEEFNDDFAFFTEQFVGYDNDDSPAQDYYGRRHMAQESSEDRYQDYAPRGNMGSTGHLGNGLGAAPPHRGSFRPTHHYPQQPYYGMRADPRFDDYDGFYPPPPPMGLYPRRGHAMTGERTIADERAMSIAEERHLAEEHALAEYYPSRLPSARLPGPSPRPPSSDHPSRPTSTAGAPVDASHPASRPASASRRASRPVSPDPTTAGGAGPRQGAIYVGPQDTQVMVETCPCCRRGF